MNRQLLLTALMFLASAPAGLSQPQGQTYDDVLRWQGARHGTLGPVGGRIYTERIDPAPGMRGEFRVGGPLTRLHDPIVLAIHDGGEQVALAPVETAWYPFHLAMTWRTDGGLVVEEKKFILEHDVFVDRVELFNTSDQTCEFDIFLNSNVTPLFERFQSRHVPLNLSAVANLAPTPGRRLFTQGEDPVAIWMEGEAAPLVSGPGAPEPAADASADTCLGIGFGSEEGGKATYLVICPRLDRPTLRLRYARGTAAPAVFRLLIDDQDAGLLRLEGTGGWGGDPSHWATVELATPALSQGRHLVALEAAAADSEIKLDGFAVMQEQDPVPDLPPEGAFVGAVAEQIHLLPGISEHDSVTFYLPDSGIESKPTMLALRGGREGDPAERFPGSIEFAATDVRPRRGIYHLFGAVLGPAGDGKPSGAPASFEFVFDNDTSERVDWPRDAASVMVPALPDEDVLVRRVEWQSVTLHRMERPALRLAYAPPPGRFVEQIRMTKGAGTGVPVLFAATVELLHETGRLQVLLGETYFHGEEVHLALGADEFALAWTPDGARALHRQATLEPGESLAFNVVLGMGHRRFFTILATQEACSNRSLFENHRTSHEAWYAENTPRFRSSDPLMEKAWCYRWYLVRQNMRRLNLPEFSLPVFYEGSHDSLAIVSTRSTPAVLSEVRWLRDPQYAQGQIRALLKQQYPDGLLPCVGPQSKGGFFCNWIPAASFETYLVNGSRQFLMETHPLLATNLDGILARFDADGDGLPAIASDSGGGMPWVETVAFASFVFASAEALSAGAGLLDQEDEARRFKAIAEQVRAAVLEQMWHPEGTFFYSQHEDGRVITTRELQGFYPFFRQLPPAGEPYQQALDALIDPEEFGTGFPFATSPADNSILADVLANALRHDQSGAITDETLARFLDAYTRLHFVEGDPKRPLLRESVDGSPDPFQSTYNDLLIRLVGGLVPRADDTIELHPLVRHLDHFRFEHIRYHGKDLDITWDRPDGNSIYSEAPEGYTLAIDGVPVLNVPRLERVEVN